MQEERKRLLFAWLSPAEPDAAFDRALAADRWAEVVLLTDLPAPVSRALIARAAARCAAPVHLRPAASGTTNDLEACMRASSAAVASAHRRHGDHVGLSFYLPGGVTVPAAVWALLAATGHPAELLRSAPDGGLVRATPSLTGRPLDAGVDLHGLIGDLARHYLRRAVAHADGNKTAAARLLGLRNYQTLDYWVAKYRV